MRITVSGLPGSGTTSLARHIAEHHGFSLISAGEVFRQMAQERGVDLAAFGEIAKNDPAIDHLIDERQKEIAGVRDNIVIEGRLSGWMVPGADLKIWLTAPVSCREERILSRDKMDALIAAQNATEERERCEAIRYRQYYGIDIRDLSLYHLILNSEKWGVSQLGAIVDCAILQLTSQAV